MNESTRTGPLADLREHPVEITLYCACTKVASGPIEFYLRKLGPDATIATIERRMICKTCKERPRALLNWEWASHPTRRHGAGEPLPAWCTIG